MKKLMSVLAVLSISALNAYTFDDLEKAIREINVKEVRHFVSCQTFTQQDKVRFCVLANEIVRNREVWTRELILDRDVTTPYKPAIGKELLELLGGYAAIIGGFAIAERGLDCEIAVGNKELCLTKNGSKGFGLALGIAGVALIIKAIVDEDKDVEKQKELFRKKYEDALTIQQLVYAAQEI